MVVKRGPVFPELFILARRARGGGKEPDALSRLGRGRDNVPDSDRIDPASDNIDLVTDRALFKRPLTGHNFERVVTRLG